MVRIAFEHSFDRVCREHQIERRLTKIKHPWSREAKKTVRGTVFPSGGQVERIPLTVCRQTAAGQRNRTIKEGEADQKKVKGNRKQSGGLVSPERGSLSR